VATSTLDALFDSAAQPVPLSANRPRLLHDRAHLWRVESGAVDLFLVRLRQGRPVGARYPLFRVEVGELLFPFAPEGGDETGWGVLASGVPGTAIRGAPWSRLDNRPAVLRALENWVEALTGALHKAAPPRDYVELDGRAGTVPPKHSALLLEGMGWLRVLEGEAVYLGIEQFPLTPEHGLLPVARDLWVDTLSECRVAITSAAKLIRDGQLRAALESLHRLALQGYAHQAEVANTQGAERLRHQRERDRSLFRGALTGLLGILEPRLAAKAAAAEGNPVLDAARLVGAELGVEIEAPIGEDADADQGVQAIARASRLRTRQVVLAGRWWSNDNGPLLAFREQDGAPLALLPRGGGYVARLPAEGGEKKVNEAFSETLKPLAHSFYRPLPSHPLSAGHLFRFARFGLGKDITTVLLMGISGGLLGLIPPIAIGMLVDTIIPGAERFQLYQLTGALIAIAIGMALFEITRAVSTVRVESRMDASLQAAVWDRILNLPVPFFRDYTAGDLATRAMGINAIRQALSGTTVTTLMASIFASFNLALMFYYSWELALVGLALVLVGVLATLGAGYLTLSYQRSVTELDGRISGLVLQLIGAIAKLRGAGAERRAFEQWSGKFSEQRQTVYKARITSAAVSTLNAVLPILSTLCIFAYMAFWADTGNVTTGQFLSFIAAFGTLLGASLQTAATVIQVLNIVPIYERAKPILLAEPEVDVRKGDPGRLSGDIEVSHVHFRYDPDGPDILKDVSIRALPGDFIALVGSSGSGKSTLLRLLLGFEQPATGAVYYDAKNLADLDLRGVRRQIGVVLQNGQLMAGDINTNIVGALPLGTDAAWEAARMAGLEADIKAMPMGMYTLVSEGSGTLSGGQRQRLLIARALVSRPRLIYFDEATSALDNPTQAQISASLDRMQATRIVIAHRLSTIRNADRIYVLDRGQVVETGDYDELMQQGGLFADLAKRQLA
jgi:NHLM bacteriocin system ABC transporter ATP-binding protein